MESFLESAARWPWFVWVGLWYALASLVTFCAFWWDKRAAQKGAWRTREWTLHQLELIGGWPGALAAIHRLRHKSSKLSFKFVTALMIVLHLAAVAGFVYLRMN